MLEKKQTHLSLVCPKDLEATWKSNFAISLFLLEKHRQEDIGPKSGQVIENLGTKTT